MAVLYFYEVPEAPLDTYDRVAAQVRAAGMPEGAIHHFGCEREGGGLIVVEVWESEAAHDRFEAQLEERIRETGGPGRPAPRKFTVRNVMSRDKTTA